MLRPVKLLHIALTVALIAPACSAQGSSSPSTSPLVASFSGRSSLERKLLSNAAPGASTRLFQFTFRTASDDTGALPMPILSVHDSSGNRVVARLTLQRAVQVTFDGTVVKGDALDWTSSWLQVNITIAEKSLALSVNGFVSQQRSTPRVGTARLGDAVDIIIGRHHSDEDDHFVGCLRSVIVDGQRLFEEFYAERRGALIGLREVYFGSTCEDRLLSCPRAESLARDGLLLVDQESALTVDTMVDISREALISFTLQTQQASAIVLNVAGVHNYITLFLEVGEVCLQCWRNRTYFALVCTRGFDITRGGAHNITLSKVNELVVLVVDGHMIDSITLPPEMLYLGGSWTFGRVDTACGANVSIGFDFPNFSGCLANLELNGFCPRKVLDFTCNTRDTAESAGIYEGCYHNFCDVEDLCEVGTCAIALTGFYCDCFGTQYAGLRCTKEGLTVTTFGNGTGFSYAFPVSELAGFSPLSLFGVPTASSGGEFETFFFYRAWEAMGYRVMLAQFWNDEPRPFLRIYQVNDSIEITRRLTNTVQTWSRDAVFVPGLATDFQYVKVSLKIVSEVFFTQLQVIVTQEGKEPRSTSFTNVSPINVTKVEFGEFNMNDDHRVSRDVATDVVLDSSSSLKGHIRAAGAVINGENVRIIDLVLSNHTGTFMTAYPHELPFSNYTTVFHMERPYMVARREQDLEELSFRFRTRHAKDDAVLLNAGVVFVMLRSGTLHVVVKRGVYETEREMVLLGERENVSGLADGEWHQFKFTIAVDIGRPQYRANVTIDDMPVVSKPAHFSIILSVDILEVHLGGTHANGTKYLPASGGFRGCVEDLWVNRDYKDLYALETPGLVDSSDIDHFCPSCTPVDPCQRGRCVEHIDNRTYSCDCSGTGYAGPGCLYEDVTATLFNNATSHLAKVQLTGDQAIPEELSFLFRVWKAENEVRVLTQNGGGHGDGSPLLVLSVDGESVVVRVQSPHSVLTTHYLPFPAVRRAFKYIPVSIRYSSTASVQNADEQQPLPATGGRVEITIGRGAAQTSLELIVGSLRTDTITFGTRDEYTSAPIKGFQGHLRAMHYNGRSLFPASLETDKQRSLVNGALLELPFDEYLVNFKTPDVYKVLNVLLPVTDLSFSMRSTGESAVVVDINGGDAGSVTLIYENDAYQLMITSARENASSPVDRMRSVPLLPTPRESQRTVERAGVLRNTWTRVEVVIGSTVEATALDPDGVSASGSLPFQATLGVSKFRTMTIGGASPERLREIGLVQAGLVGCIKELWVNHDYVDLPDTTTRHGGADLTTVTTDASPTDLTSGVCTGCQPQSLCHNGGVCLAETSGDEFQCLCNETGFVGQLCDIVPTSPPPTTPTTTPTTPTTTPTTPTTTPTTPTTTPTTPTTTPTTPTTTPTSATPTSVMPTTPQRPVKTSDAPPADVTKKLPPSDPPLPTIGESIKKVEGDADLSLLWMLLLLIPGLILLAAIIVWAIYKYRRRYTGKFIINEQISPRKRIF